MNVNGISKLNKNESSTDASATNELAKTIKPINKSAIHRICSGQVVLSLATAVKELVENSLDAGAKSIEVRLKDHGISSIEVSDNGTGICSEDFKQFAMKHSTSKLQDFEDLVEVNTFGFRGEAISSLCALSNITLTTRHKDETVGTKMVYDHCGNIKEQVSVSRQNGTTILLANLFQTLPVRHKEFTRNIKREFNKMVHILYSYCVISTDVRISCTNCDKGRKTTVVSTDASPSIKDNISSIFGPKQVVSLLPINDDCDLCNATLEEYGVEDSQIRNEVQLEGYISSCAHGSGRSSVDRQFYFINSRPCDPSKVSRLVNEIYHQFNKYQYPMIVLNIKLKADDVDINVTPDKRSIFTSKEKHLLALIKSTLLKIYEKIPSTFVMQSPLSISTFASNSPLNETDRTAFSPKFSTPTNRKITVSGTGNRSLSARFSRTTPSSVFGNSNFNSNCKRPFSSDCKNKDRSIIKQRKLENYFAENITSSQDIQNTGPLIENTSINNGAINLGISHNNGISIIAENCDNTSLHEPDEIFSISKDIEDIKKISKPCQLVHQETDLFLDRLKSKYKKTSDELQEKSNHFCVDNCVPSDAIPNLGVSQEDENKSSNFGVDDVMVVEILDNTGSPSSNKKCLDVKFSLALIKHKLARCNNIAKAENLHRKFRAKIDVTENDSAENELKREITKENFAKMDVIGQFNLGFIIAQLDSDLFIIDQHATDEEYNFENLQRNHVLLQQPMITPQELQLTPVNESILLDNLTIFKQNGFHFNVNDSNVVGRRVSLTSVPHSRGWEFGVQDIEELIFMLSDSTGQMCRPSRVRAMLASRACRQSVMIGTALDASQMKKLIRHMGEIDHPWNCPHGRPTMRHLINIKMISDLSL